ncbi:glycerol-3-phosphate dehydrogenase, partial [Arthrobacter sp. 2YAF22_2]
MTAELAGPSSAGSAVRVAVLGAGSWGTTFAKILADAAEASDVDRRIRLWGRRAAVVDQI